MRRGLNRTVAALLVTCAALSGPVAGAAEDAKLVAQLNDEYKDVRASNRTAGPILAAYLKMTPPPKELGEGFNQETIWPGMDGWEQVAKWAQANSAMGDALIANQFGIIFGLPYGVAGADPAFKKAGLCIELGEGPQVGRIHYGYFKAIDAINAYAAAEMYRLAESGNYSMAFKIGIANARLMRQLCEQPMLEEKLFGLRSLATVLSIHRDLMWTYHKKLPVATMKLVALKEYSFLRPSDNERMRRLEMPEGDRIVAEAVLRQALVAQADGTGIDPDKFAQVVGGQGTDGGALQKFNTQEMWRRVAGVHGSVEASTEKLLNVYDDWWRRWRVRPFTALHQIPTEFSRANPIKYAALLAMVADMAEAFAWRDVVIAEVNGTTMSAGLCGYFQEFKQTWPKDRERAYAVFFQKRYDFDPFDKEYGRLQYRFLGSEKQAIETPLGRVWATGAMVWALGANHEDNEGITHSTDASVGDLLIWPPVRALARQEGLLR